MAVSPDGRLLVAAGLDGRISLWVVSTPLAGDAEQIAAEIERLTGLTLDARVVIRSLDAKPR